MRNLLVVAMALWVSGLASAQDSPEQMARDVVSKAIKAMGLEDQETPKSIRVKSTSTIKTAQSAEVKLEKTLTMRLPNQVKEVNVGSLGGQSMLFTSVYDGQNAWINANGKVMDLQPAELADFREMSNMIEATYFLTPLLDKQKYKLSAVGLGVVEGRQVYEIVVSRQGFQDMKLFFDSKTNLLAKMERKGYDPVARAQCQETRFYRLYQKMNGRLVPSLISWMRDGQVVLEMNILEFAVANDVGPEEFVRPKE